MPGSQLMAELEGLSFETKRFISTRSETHDNPLSHSTSEIRIFKILNFKSEFQKKTKNGFADSELSPKILFT